MNKIIFICVLLLGLNVGVHSLDCSKIVKAYSEGVLNWLADVTFTVPVNTDEKGWIVRLDFDQEFTGVGAWDAWVTVDGKEKWAMLTNRDYNAVQEAGKPLFFRFRVNYFTNVTKPQVVSLTFQSIQLCV